MRTSYLPEQDIAPAPFAEDRFADKPTRTGGVSTAPHPKGVPYSEEAPVLGSWLQQYIPREEDHSFLAELKGQTKKPSVYAAASSRRLLGLALKGFRSRAICLARKSFARL